MNKLYWLSQLVPPAQFRVTTMWTDCARTFSQVTEGKFCHHLPYFARLAMTLF